ncbi:hypothetical protein GOBAR_AA19976 [Gossypium barbadense]|uniref:Secreted protein n=1 Tax=Gossypium barbadense TaxID=3634 RepID=A0A2P5XBG3_GOSBA|nr:hypothetical protein GOBAR_AA19976 [Gossypium barbadense]
MSGLLVLGLSCLVARKKSQSCLYPLSVIDFPPAGFRNIQKGIPVSESFALQGASEFEQETERTVSEPCDEDE